MKQKTERPIPVPCGKCPECLARRASGWSFRLVQEEKRALSAHFLTLTYDTSHVPISEKGFMTLNKRDVQLFFKRLRKAHGKHHPKITYYAVGEYGTKNRRPHYHVICFNVQLQHIQPSWQLGQVHYGSVTGASIGYTLKYMSKPRTCPSHKNDDRVPEFSLMSKGIGSGYLTPAMVNWHISDTDNRMYINVGDNKRASMPRYYKDRIYSEQQRKRVAFIQSFKANEIAEKERAILMELHGDRYYEVLVEIHKQKFKKMHNDSLKNRNL